MIGVLLCQAQKHLTFLDIPIEGSLESFSKRLEKELGYRPMLMNEGDSYADCESKKFMGKFMDFHRTLREKGVVRPFTGFEDVSHDLVIH